MTQMPLPTVAQFVRSRSNDTSTALVFEGQSWTWAEHTREAAARASWYRAQRGSEGPPHVGVLLENVPEYSFWLAAAALGRFVIVGLNPTRTPDLLLQDVRSTQCDLVITDRPELVAQAGIEVVVPGEVSFPAADLPTDPADPSDLFLLIFTSGTTGTAKAVKCSQGKIAALSLGLCGIVELSAKDTTYLSMPLFHSNAIITNWAPAAAVGATIVLKRRFSASTFLADCREHGATYANYVGTPLSYVLAQPESPDDADNPLTRVFGNEGAPADLERFAQRFACRVVDGFGSTEGGISITRTPDTPPGSLGKGVGDIRVLKQGGEECSSARFDADGRLLNADEAVGELVNMDGAMFFEGYWNAPEDEAQRLRDGRYWSGDLAYKDTEGFLYFAGRSLDRLRIRGENLPAAPISRLYCEHPAVLEAVAYGVPDPVAGDQLVIAVEGTRDFRPDDLLSFARERSAPQTWLPDYVRVTALPRTATGKTLVRQLAAEGWGAEHVWMRDGDYYRLMTAQDREALLERFKLSGRPLPLWKF
jgi:fatty-acyl-CoA synthase